MPNIIIDDVLTTSVLSKLQHPIKLVKKSIMGEIPYIIGITGAPGVGKTTTAKILHEYISTMGIISYRAGLEDFYFSKEKREELGIKWHALPGTHDTAELINILHGIKNKKKIKNIPRYCMVNDIPILPTEVNNVINCFILEGWFLNTNINEYSRIAEYIDYLIYLDADYVMLKNGDFKEKKHIEQILMADIPLSK